MNLRTAEQRLPNPIFHCFSSQMHRLLNSSVATIPTLFDIVRKENYKGHKISNGDVIMFASVGAGMNVNAITYQV